MEEKEIYLTRDGADRLKSDLEELTGPRRDELAKRLRHAISMGDLSENADYTAAKEEQAFLEGKILEIQTILRKATIVEEPPSNDVVGIGSVVVVSEDGDRETYRLVGMREADPRNGKISNESPIGEALLGKRVGDTTVAETPGGKIQLIIIEIR
jgi:transcription elongation factor GreA